MRVKHRCSEQSYNPNMGVECYAGKNHIFYFDKNGWIKVGDVVEIERDEKGFTKNVWVNGELKTTIIQNKNL